MGIPSFLRPENFWTVFLRNSVTTLSSRGRISSIWDNSSVLFSVIEIESSINGWASVFSQFLSESMMYLSIYSISEHIFYLKINFTWTHILPEHVTISITWTYILLSWTFSLKNNHTNSTLRIKLFNEIFLLFCNL